MGETYPHSAGCYCSARPALSNSSYSHGSWLMWRWRRCRNRCHFHSLIAIAVARRLEPVVTGIGIVMSLSVPELVAMCRPWRPTAADDSDCRWSWVASGSDCCCCHSSWPGSCCCLPQRRRRRHPTMASDPSCWPTSWAALMVHWTRMSMWLRRRWCRSW